jgi:uncharacterized membrane protein YGL010W
MRSQDQFLDEYRRTHSNATNMLVHMICVPVILFASFGLLWTAPIGYWLGLSGDYVAWVNGGTVVGLLAVIFYANLSARAGLLMTLVLLICAAGVIGLRHAGIPLGWFCASIWIAAWLGQFYGHHVEGAKPAFLDDIVFLLIGPLFILDEYALLGNRRA